MKKLSFLLSIFVLVITFSCDDEPLDRDIQIVSEMTCETAIANTAIAASAFAGATADNFQNLCNQLKTALQAQLVACGDADGSLQATINGLGNCSNNNQDPCAIATQAAQLAETAFNNANMDNYSNLCNAYKVVLENQISACGDDDGSIQTLIDDLGDCTNDNTPQYEIGDIGPAGGFVFYVDENGGGMEIAPVEVQFLTQWGCYSTSISGTVTDFGSGLDNTNVILAYHENINFYNDPEQCQEFVNPVGVIQSTGDVAAKKCSDLDFNGFNDWYLPSIGELELVYTNLITQDFGDFSESIASSLVSSSDDYSDDYRLFTINLTNGSIINDYKYNLVYYRAVRSF